MNIQNEGITIYIRASKTSLIEAVYIETNEDPLELREREMGLTLLYKLLKLVGVSLRTLIRVI